MNPPIKSLDLLIDEVIANEIDFWIESRKQLEEDDVDDDGSS